MGYGSFTYPFNDPSYAFGTTNTQSSLAVTVPPANGFPISINNRTYMADTSFEPYRREAFRHKSLQSQRQSLHFTNNPDDGTVSTEGLWRREARDWSLGSGQIYFDRTKSSPERFAHSKGVNPWIQWQLTLLQDTLKQYTSTNKTKAIHIGQYVYIADGNTVKFTKAASTGSTTWSSTYTTLAGTANGGTFGGTFLDMTTDGYYLYVLTTTGVWRFAAGTATPYDWFVKQTTSFSANLGSPYSLTGIIAWVGGRLMMALNNVASWATGAPAGSSLIDLSQVPHASGTSLAVNAPEVLYTHPSPNWVWSAIAAGSQNLYFSGYNYDGVTYDRGSVFRSSVNQNISTSGMADLNSPVQALPMTPGEYPTAMKGYLNYIFLGTNKGIRMCESLNLYDPTGNAGDLKSGPLLPDITEVPSRPVTAIVGDDRYIYWSWNNYDTASTGLGRLDLTSFIDPLAPAYASDLMVNGQGSGMGACTWLDWDPITNSPLMSMNGLTYNGTTGNYVYTADPNSCVASGSVDSGLITYGIPDNKNATKIEMNVENANGSSLAFTLAVDNATPLEVGTYTNSLQQGVFDFMASGGIGQQFGEQYRIITTLNAGTANGYRTSPVLNRWTLKALPGIPSGIMISAVILLYEPFEMEGQTIYMDPYAEYAYLENLRQKQIVVPYAEGPFTANVTVDVIDWLPERRRDVRQGGYHGDMVVYCKTVSG